MKPPPFDATAKLHAKGLAITLGKPKARDEGLMALHAVLHVKTAEAAYKHFGVSRQRFSEWKRIHELASSSVQQPFTKPFEDAVLLVSPDWIKANMQMLQVLNVGGKILQDGRSLKDCKNPPVVLRVYCCFPAMEAQEGTWFICWPYLILCSDSARSGENDAPRCVHYPLP